jgi:hypothetical protein
VKVPVRTSTESSPGEASIAHPRSGDGLRLFASRTTPTSRRPERSRRSLSTRPPGVFGSSTRTRSDGPLSAASACSSQGPRRGPAPRTALGIDDGEGARSFGPAQAHQLQREGGGGTAVRVQDAPGEHAPGPDGEGHLGVARLDRHPLGEQISGGGLRPAHLRRHLLEAEAPLGIGGHRGGEDHAWRPVLARGQHRG